MNIWLKSFLSEALSASGLLSLAEGVSRAPWGMVFMLHRVLPTQEVEHVYNPYLAITQESFEAFLDFLMRRWRVVPLAELVSRMLGGQKCSPLCALTFDDGWEDNYRVAWPVLRKFGAPATIFLPTAFVGSRDLLPEERLRRLWQAAKLGGLWRSFDDAFRHRLPPSPGASGAPYERYHGCLKQMPQHERVQLFAQLEQGLGAVTPEKSSFLGWEQIREMARDGISFGSHTVHHVSLTHEELDVIRYELSHSKRVLEEGMGCAIEHLAYPSGIYDKQVRELTAEAGYRAAFTTELGAISPGADAYRLARVPVDNATLNGSRGEFSAARARVHLMRARMASGSPSVGRLA